MYVGRKQKVNWKTVCGAIQHLPRRNIWSADNPVEVFNEHLLLLVGSLVLTKSAMCATRISLGLMICKHALGLKQEAHIRWTRDRSMSG